MRAPCADRALQTATGEESILAGKSTLCRMEQPVERLAGIKTHLLMGHHFIEQHQTPPKEIVLDFCGTDIRVHGDPPSNYAM